MTAHGFEITAYQTKDRYIVKNSVYIYVRSFELYLKPSIWNTEICLISHSYSIYKQLIFSHSNSPKAHFLGFSYILYDIQQYLVVSSIK